MGGPQPHILTIVDFRIAEEYSMNWDIDGLPASQVFRDESTKELFYNPGIPLGMMDNETPILNNHYDIHIRYHRKDAERIRIVGVIANPSSYVVPLHPLWITRLLDYQKHLRTTNVLVELVFSHYLISKKRP